MSARTLPELEGVLAACEASSNIRIDRLTRDGVALAARVSALEAQADAAASSAADEARHARGAERMVIVGSAFAVLAALAQLRA